MRKTYEDLLLEEANFIFDEFDSVDWQFQEGVITVEQAITRLKELVNSPELETAMKNWKESENGTKD